MLLSLYQEGVINQDILKRAIKLKNPIIPSLELKSGSSPETLAIAWLFDYLFKADIIGIIIKTGPSNTLIREIAINLGMYDPQTGDKSIYQRVDIYLRRSIVRMFGIDDFNAIYNLLMSNKI